MWESVVASGSDEPVLVFEDDAAFTVPDVAAWFASVVLPQLPADWAFCYLNEPLHLEMARQQQRAVDSNMQCRLCSTEKLRVA